MKNKHKTATFLRHLALTLMVAMLAAAFQPARAQDSYPEYISEVKVLGCADRTNINTVSDSYTQNGWTLVDYDLNKGAYGDHIYLIYKKTSRNNTDGRYITDFIVSDVETPSNTLTYNGRTYHLCSCDGYSTFTNSKGNLNRGASDNRYVYLYYTTDNFDDKRAVTGISFDATSSNAVQLQCTTCQLGTTTYKEADFNRGAEPSSSPNIYMHITTATKSNRPSNDPVMASGLTFNGDPQALLSINNTNTGTMMYSVNDGGFSSTIPTATDAGNYTVKYYAASNNYGDQSETKSQTVSIAKANNNKVTTTAALNLAYNGSAQKLINAYSATFGTVQYSLDGTNYSATVPQGKDAKTYTIYYKVEGTSNYNSVSGEATATIKKAANRVTTTAALNLTYNGSAQNLITAYSATFGTVQYSLDGTTYYATIPQGKDAKTYTIHYKVAGTSNYNGVSGEATATIKKAANSVTTTEALNLTYNGSAQNLIEPYTATDGVVLYSLDNTTFSSDIPQATGAKDYTIYYKVAETPNYNGVSGTATATIKKAANNNATVSIANSIDGRENVNTTVNNNLSSGTITYLYSTLPSSDFSTAKPNAPGTWYVKATIDADDNYEAYTTDTQNFILIDWEGDGTSSSPYLIKSTTDLDLLATKVNSGYVSEGKYFKLGNNITYSYENLGETESNFTAIGNWTNRFKGNFDGDGKKISGIRIDKPDDVFQGLFGYIHNANVENIILTDTKITGRQYVGGIAGYCCESTIRNCIVDNVFVKGSSQCCGGIAGMVDGTLVGNLIVNSTITVAEPDEYIYTGAITGSCYGSLENNYYYNCKVIVGETENTTDVGCGQTGTLPHDIDGARQAVQISAAEGITFQITSNNSVPYKNHIYVGVGATVTLTISDDKGYKYYTNGKGIYFTNGDGNSSNFTVTDANDIVITGTNENPVEGKISISAIDNRITILPKENAVLLDDKCYAEDGATVTLAINDIYKPDEGYTVSGYTYAEGESLTKNADGNYTFTVPSDDVTISRVITDVWNVENGADGSADHPYIITTPAGLDLLATKVNADMHYQKHFELGADIDYNDVPAKDESGSNFTPIGKDRDYSFKGSFDGKEYTISGIVLNSENASFQGLFGYVGYDWSRPDDYYIVKNGYYIVKNVILASSTIKGSGLVGGIAGGSAGMISNCTVKSDVKIYARECGGILEYNNGFVEKCTSSAQLEGNGGGFIGGIAGESRRHGLANNNAIGVKISGTFIKAGAITPYTTNEDSLHNNFYLNCMVLDKTAGIGYNGEDFTKNNGAVSLHTITLGEGISITSPASPTLTSNGIDYYAQGTEITLSYTAPEGCTLKEYKVNGSAITSNKFTMPAANTTVAAAVEQYYSITLGEGISIESPTSPALTSNGINYYAQGTEITLSYSGTVPEGALLYYTINNGKPTTSNKFTMPAANTTASIIFKPEDYVIDLTSSEPFEIDIDDFEYVFGSWSDNNTAYYDFYVSYPKFIHSLDLDLDGTPDAEIVINDYNNSAIAIRLSGANSINENISFALDYDATGYKHLVFKFGDNYQTKEAIPLFAIKENVTDNSDRIIYLVEDINITTTNVMLQGRTLYRDGRWQTICLPFDVDLTDEDSPLYQATAYKLQSATIEGSTITADFGSPVTQLEANVPYIIKWNKNLGLEDLKNPIFMDASFDISGNSSTDIPFVGSIDMLPYVGGAIEACRAAFYVGNKPDDENFALYPATGITINGGNLGISADDIAILTYGEPLSIENVTVLPAAYTGESLRPVLKDGDYTLEEFKDYYIDDNVIYNGSYVENIVEPGVYTVTFIGLGIYSGTTTKQFVVTQDLVITKDLVINTYQEKEVFWGWFDANEQYNYGANNNGILLDLNLDDTPDVMLTFDDERNMEVLPDEGANSITTNLRFALDEATVHETGYSHIVFKFDDNYETVDVTKDLVIDLGFKISALPSAQDAIVLNAWIDNNVAYIYDVDQDNEIVLLNLNFDDTPDVKLEFDEISFVASRGEGANSITTNLRFALDETLVEHFGYGHIVFMFGRSYETVDVGKIGALTIYEYGDKTTASIDGNYNAADALSITNDINVTSVTLVRDFTEGKYATVVLPFAATANASDGTFYTFEGVTYDKEKSTWVAGVSSVTSLKPHTPYIFEPKSNLTSLTWNVATTIYTKPTSAATTEVADETYGKWIFKGVYEPERWTERQTKIYGFAGAETTNRDDQEIHIGDFVRAGYNSSIRPFRCYLEYSGEGGKIDLSTLSKSSLTLPDRIEVRVINSVLEPDDPQENPNGDIETPTSEITPAANVKVWSFDKTIYIAAAPNTPYMIVDMSGRQLQTGITATSRDEIHLPGKVDGIVIVRVANQSFKIRY